MIVTANLRFTLDWIDKVDGSTVVTMANMRASLDGGQFWPSQKDAPDGEPMEWFADQLLAHLTVHWKRLLVEQGYPLTYSPVRPSDIWEKARIQWSGMPENLMIDLQDKIVAFQKCHDLSFAFSGIFGLDPFWIVRECSNFVIDNGEICVRVKFDNMVEELSKIGDDIASRLGGSGSSQWNRLLHAWRNRNSGDGRRLLILATRLDEPTVDSFVSQELLTSNDNVFEAARETEVKVAARMASALPPDSIAQILRAVLDAPKGSCHMLDQLSQGVMDILNKHNPTLPYEQGVLAAEALRDMLRIEERNKADPFSIMEQAGVAIHEVEFNAVVDAVACWGPNHGPSVFFNAKANRLKGTTAALRSSGQGRVTAAHELCHLLLDRENMITAVEVLNGRTPTAFEQRAKAFAGAFLLPKREAVRQWDEDNQPTDYEGIKKTLRRLMNKFNVTQTVAAWKLEHAIDHTDEKYITLKKSLDLIVNPPING